MPISRSNRINIAVTIGDPSGVGPEIALKSLASPKVKGLANFFVIGDRYIVDRLNADMGLRLKAELIDLGNVDKNRFSYGRLRPDFGRASIQYLDKAIELFRAGAIDAVVTAPINKAAVKKSGLKNFQGHTEYFAEKTAASKFAMMFVGDKLKIVPITRHIPLKEVSRNLTPVMVRDSIELVHRSLTGLFGIKHPRIGVTGLNPHAGEGGSFGDEESAVIAPAIKEISRRFHGVRGPLPADVVFYDALNGKFDAIVAMYHDQALGPFKMLYFKTGVNLTLGLPFIRTSPDHGTAFDIAGNGLADPSSMQEAILLACRLCAKRWLARR